MVRVPECRRIDLEAELQPGRLVLLDSGMHQPVQHYAHLVANLGSFAHRRTVEILSWGSKAAEISHHQRHDSHHRDMNKLPRYAEPSGSYGIVHRKVFERDGERVSELEKYSTKGVVEKVNPDFAAEIEASIEGNLKTLVELENRKGIEAEMERALVESIDIGIAAVECAKAAGREVPVFVIDVMMDDDSPAIRDALTRLKTAGAPILLVYVVCRPCPMSDMPSDLHMIERIQLKSRFADEVMLSTDERVVIAGMNESWNIDKPRWVDRDVSSARCSPLPSITKSKGRLPDGKDKGLPPPYRGMEA
jgi:hypothetical protein